MLFSDPKWGKGCLTMVAAVAGFTLLGYMFPGTPRSRAHLQPQPSVLETVAYTIIGLLVVLGIVRFILNQIFD